MVYTLAGLLYGIAALLLISRTGVGDPQAGQTDNLDSITAVVLGGTSLFGGRGSVLGTLIGVLIVGVFRNGLPLMGVASIYQTLITGVLVILAVTVDQISRGRPDDRQPRSRTPILPARGLVKRYGHVTAIDGADFDLLPGEVLAVIGDNGAGKTSLIKALTGAVIPDEGEIRLNGEPITSRAPQTPAAPASRRSIRTSRWPPRWTSPPTCSSVASCAAPASSAASCACSTRSACARRPPSTWPT